MAASPQLGGDPPTAAQGAMCYTDPLIEARYPHLSRRHPRPDGQTVALPCGRRIAYCEYVGSDVIAPEALPVLVLLPGTPGTRFFTHPLAKAAGGHLPGWRLIVMERPGGWVPLVPLRMRVHAPFTLRPHPPCRAAACLAHHMHARGRPEACARRHP